MFNTMLIKHSIKIIFPEQSWWDDSKDRWLLPTSNCLSYAWLDLFCRLQSTRTWRLNKKQLISPAYHIFFDTLPHEIDSLSLWYSAIMWAGVHLHWRQFDLSRVSSFSSLFLLLSSITSSIAFSSLFPPLPFFTCISSSFLLQSSWPSKISFRHCSETHHQRPYSTVLTNTEIH